MKFFGPERWGNRAIEWVEIPVGQPCHDCEKPIEATDSGLLMPYAHETGVSEIAMHKKCFLAQIFGPEKT